MTIAETARIHPTAIVEAGATVGADAAIGPYCVVGPEVRLGEGVRLDAHVCVSGITGIGARTRIFPFASIGSEPQDLKYQGERVTLDIGADCTIREHVTMNPGTGGGGGATRVGARSLFMAGAHVAHDCIVGDNVILANNATLAGHVEIGDFAILGGLCAVHQFTRIGAHAMVGGMSGVEKDIIPFGSVIGNRARLAGLNLIGMKRRGLDRAAIHAVRALFRDVFEGEGGSLADRAAAAAARWPDIAPVQEICAFIAADSRRSFCLPEA